jgi:hypothetical protein
VQPDGGLSGDGAGEQRLRLGVELRARGWAQPGLHRGRGHPERFHQQPVLVDLMAAWIRERDPIRQQRASRVGVEADAAPRVPAAGGARGLEGVRQDEGDVRPRAGQRVGESAPPRTRRILEKCVGHALSPAARRPSGPPR